MHYVCVNTETRLQAELVCVFEKKKEKLLLYRVQYTIYYSYSYSYSFTRQANERTLRWPLIGWEAHATDSFDRKRAHLSPPVNLSIV
jgi:hypothetical protein